MSSGLAVSRVLSVKCNAIITLLGGDDRQNTVDHGAINGLAELSSHEPKIIELLMVDIAKTNCFRKMKKFSSFNQIGNERFGIRSSSEH